MNDNEQMIADLRSVIESLEKMKHEAIKTGNSRKEIICEDKINIINDLINELLLKNNDEDIVWRVKSILAEYGIDREEEKIKKFSKQMDFLPWIGFFVGLIVSVTYNLIRGLGTTYSKGNVVKDVMFPIISILGCSIVGYIIGMKHVIENQKNREMTYKEELKEELHSAMTIFLIRKTVLSVFSKNNKTIVDYEYKYNRIKELREKIFEENDNIEILHEAKKIIADYKLIKKVDKITKIGLGIGLLLCVIIDLFIARLNTFSFVVFLIVGALIGRAVGKRIIRNNDNKNSPIKK